jgi:hypothetical protein
LIKPDQTNGSYFGFTSYQHYGQDLGSTKGHTLVDPYGKTSNVLDNAGQGD